MRTVILKQAVRAILAVCFGAIATVALFCVFLFLDRVVFTGDPTVPLDVRMPSAWILTWPHHFWSFILSSSDPVTAMVVTHVAIFSLIAYAVSFMIDGQKQLA